MFCPNCGTSQDSSAKFCRECGAELIQGQAAQAPQAEPVPVPVQTSQIEQSHVPPIQNIKSSEPTVQYTQASSQQPQNTVSLDKPLSVWQYIGIFLISYIPIVGIVFIFIWAFGSNVNTNKKNFSRAVLIIALVMIVFSIVMTILFGAVITSLFEYTTTY